MFLALSLSSLAVSSALSHHTQKAQSILPKSDRHNAKILLKLEAEASKSDHRTQDSQVLFTDILSEISTLKSTYGKVVSPHVSLDLLKKLEATETEQGSLRAGRGLMKKNNFIELAVHSDMDCMTKTRSVGRLVNYCYNEYESSYLFKVNRKENIIAQIEYSELNCMGTPSKVTDLQYVTHTGTTEFSECVNGVKWSYLSDYPAFHSASTGGYGSTYSNAEICDPNKKNFYGYDFRSADTCIRIVSQNGVYNKADVKGCETTKTVTSNYYFDPTCSGTVAYSVSSMAAVCEYPSWWDGDDQDDFKQDGSNYVIGEVHTDYCHDPTDSTEPTPPVTGTCDATYFQWVGDGYCDDSTNNAGCNYDGGDCCKQTCVSTVYDCGVVGFTCLNPAFAPPPI